MSCRAASYSVASAEELQRRRLAAARDRYERTVAALGVLTVEIKAAIATYGSLEVDAPISENVSGVDAEQWERAASDLAAGIVQTQASLERAVQQALVDRIAKSSHLLTSSLSEESPAGSVGHQSDGDLARVLSRLPSSASAQTIERCESLAASVRSTASRNDRDVLLSSLRLVVQQEQDKAALVAANTKEIERLYAELDGLRGHQVETLRGTLKALPRDQPLPVDLEGHVVRARGEALATADRDFVLEQASGALEELGYIVGEGFSTAVADHGAIVDLPGSNRHGLLIRERNHQLMFNVVRYDESGSRDPAVDTQAEEDFCHDFAGLSRRFKELGIELAMSRADPPGSHPVQVVRQAPRRPRPPQVKMRLRERER
jgi:hypothetical protein